MSSFCPECGAAVKPEYRVCGNCGKPLAQAVAQPSQCAQCGTVVQNGGAFCPNCGGSMASAAMPVMPVMTQPFKPARSRSGMIVSAITAVLAFLAFISFAMPMISLWGVSASGFTLIDEDAAEATLMLLALLCSIACLICAVGAVFKRPLAIISLILAPIGMFLMFGAMVDMLELIAAGFIIFMLAMSAVFITSIVRLAVK